MPAAQIRFHVKDSIGPSQDGDHENKLRPYSMHRTSSRKRNFVKILLPTHLAVFGSRWLQRASTRPISFNGESLSALQNFAQQPASYSPALKVVFENGINRPDAVFPVDLLALRICASAV